MAVIIKMKSLKHDTMKSAAGRSLLAVWVAAALLLSFPATGLCGTDFRYLTLKHVRDIEGSFNQPTEVAVASDDKTYVLDGAKNKVKVFDDTGSFLFSFGQYGAKEGELDHPVGMDVDAQENIYVADTGNKRIQIFDGQGKFVRLIDLASMNARPVEVKHIQESGRIYVSDTENQQIHCFDKDGVFQFSWGGYGKKRGEFMYPGMIDTDPSGNIHVVDILNGRLQIFDAAGKMPRELGKFGIKPGNLFRPKGVLVDKQSHVYVSDSYTGVIQVFDADGKLVGILSEDGKSPLRLSTPLGMAMDSAKKQLYVVEAERNKVSVFELREDI